MFSGLVAILLLVSGCWTGSGGADTFCLIYRPLPFGSLAGVAVSERALAVMLDNEIAYKELCGDA